MDVEYIINELGGNSLSNDSIEKLRLDVCAAKLAPKKIKKEIELKVQDLLALMGTNNAREAKLLTRALIVFSAEQSMREIRRVGVFRSSKYNFKLSVAKAVVKDCLVSADFLGLDSEQRAYLTSVESLLAIGSRVRQVNDGLISAVTLRKKLIIKTLLANVEILFATRLPDVNKFLSSEDLGHYSNEDLAEAFSYILKLHCEKFEAVNEFFQHVDESASSTDIYWRLLIDAAKICKYKDAELLLDAFPYRAVQSSGELRIESIDPLLEQSIRLGYMQAMQQMMVRKIGLEENVFNESNLNRPASIKKFADEYYDAGKEKVIFVNPDPISRYVLGFVMDLALFKPFSTDDLFEEEIEAFVNLGLDNYDYGALKDINIRDDISALDIMKVQRIFRFVNVVFQRALADHQGSDQYAISMRSVLPTFSERKIGQFLKLILPNRDYKEVLSLISLDLSNFSHVDIQYTPLIKLNGHYIVAPAVVANSNLTRNIFCAQNIKQPFVGDSDPMQAKIADALEFQGFAVAQEVNILFQKKQMETDIVAFKEGKLFLIECKNPYHPCNIHEMRNGFDHISYGAHQLDVRKDWLSCVNEQKRLFAAAGFDYTPVTEIYTCIAVASRVFNGYRLHDHPVCQGHELINVIKSGVVNVAGIKRRVWVDEGFSVEDLIAYLDGSTTLKDCLSSLQHINIDYAFKDRSISFSTYLFDMEHLSKVSERYPEAFGL
jgi:hypothetical protein